MELKWKECSSKGFFAHKNDPLKDHLLLTGELAEKILLEQGVNDATLLKVARVIGMAHDVGKYTEYFQKKLNRETVEKQLTSHSQISAAYCAWALDKLLHNGFYTTIGFLAVRCHHGQISTDSDLLSDFGEELKRYLKEQARCLERCQELIDIELESIGMPRISEFIPDLRSGKAYAILKPLFKEIRKQRDLELYFQTLLLYSALINADKLASSGIRNIERKAVERNLFSETKPKQMADEKVIRMREEVYDTVFENLREHLRRSELPRIFTIKAPTGAGKTRAALSVAMELRKEIKARYNYTPRIIYCLPFINIIEQTYKYIADTIGNNVVLRHHTYSPVYQGNEDSENLPLSQALLLTESWDSEIVVSTFVQLFETLIGNKNHMLLKFNKTIGSIIILDEVQAINSDIWPLIRYVLDELSKHSYLIIMSATLPELFLSKGKYVDLTKGLSAYDSLNRVGMSFEGKKSADELVDFACSKLGGCRSMAMILNTISESIYIYRRIKEKLKQIYGDDRVKHVLDEGLEPDVYISYLSTNIIPADRESFTDRHDSVLGRIQKLLNEKKKLVLVCTQVIEAGIDLDFDIIIRDIAPFDSLVQSAGRCNRNGMASGRMYVVEVDFKGKSTYERVYGEPSVEATKELLCKPISESEFDTMADRYYRELARRKALNSNDYSDGMIECMKRMEFGEIGKFKVIKDVEKVNIFIEKGQRAKELLNNLRIEVERLKRAREEGDYEKILELHRTIEFLRKQVSLYMIEVFYERADSVPVESLSELFGAYDVRYVRIEDIEKYYNKETGFNLGVESSAVII